MFSRYFRFTLLLLAFVVLFAACGEDDNPIIDDDHDHEDEPFHADADGFVLKVDGNQIYRQFEGEHEGGITLKVGEELEVAATFLDHDGDEFLPENPEEGDEHDHDHDHGEEEVFALSLSAFDSSIIKIHLHEHEDEHDHEDDHDDEDEHHDEELAEQFTFEVDGLKAGETTIKFQLLHGDHADFTGALMIPVTVTP
ncbi:hypothetical protein F4X33_09200 [Candidatus Poribacteria bacterium]|nr:hypothetical protein [Candidatus Poribacteria bacterium]